MIGKVFLAVVVIYLLIFLPLYLQNLEVEEMCYEKCLEVEGEIYNIITRGALVGSDKVECLCYNSFTRKKELILFDV